MGADIILAVNTASSNKTLDQLDNIFDVLEQAISVHEYAKEYENMAAAKVQLSANDQAANNQQQQSTLAHFREGGERQNGPRRQLIEPANLFPLSSAYSSPQRNQKTGRYIPFPVRCTARCSIFSPHPFSPYLPFLRLVIHTCNHERDLI